MDELMCKARIELDTNETEESIEPATKDDEE
jgi:hypothetical protein